LVNDDKCCGFFLHIFYNDLKNHFVAGHGGAHREFQLHSRQREDLKFKANSAQVRGPVSKTKIQTQKKTCL
jgi:hypothetical protein